jgi:predicted DNA-binding transcriptional regulator YafY
MRASRLVAIVLLLQNRGRMTAPQLAAELEVSVRTIYRDLDALCTSGVPVYAETGPQGGYRLVEGYQTRLTGLSAEEAEALLLAGVPGPLGDLGLGAAVTGGQRKLLAALPEHLRVQAAKARERYHVDLAVWFSPPAVPPLLGQVAAAVWEDRRVAMGYEPDVGPSWTREVDPLGLVLKVSTWYMVGARPRGLRTYRVDRITSIEVLGQPCRRPEGFDLAGYWQQWLADFEARLPAVTVEVRARPEVIPRLRYLVDRRSLASTDWDGRADEDGHAGEGGWRRLSVTFERLSEARTALLGLGDLVEVLGPAELRAGIAATARGLAEIYARP